jgi:hypothetical protein
MERVAVAAFVGIAPQGYARRRRGNGAGGEDESGQVPEESGQVPDESGQVPDESGQVPDESGQVPDESGQVPDTLSGSGSPFPAPFGSCCRSRGGSFADIFPRIYNILDHFLEM